MAGGPPSLEARPNGTFIAYFGDGTSCVKHLLDKQDWFEAIRRQDANKWAMAPQSGTVFTGPGFDTIKFGCYRGWV